MLLLSNAQLQFLKMNGWPEVSKCCRDKRVFPITNLALKSNNPNIQAGLFSAKYCRDSYFRP